MSNKKVDLIFGGDIFSANKRKESTTKSN